LIKLFQKFAGSKGRALGRLRRGETISAFLVLFAPAVPKRTETVFSHFTSTVNQHHSYVGEDIILPQVKGSLICLGVGKPNSTLAGG
jgi:hypothetical protein